MGTIAGIRGLFQQGIGEFSGKSCINCAELIRELLSNVVLRTSGSGDDFGLNSLGL